MARSADKPPKKLVLRENESLRLVARPARGATFYKYILTLGLYGFWRKRNTMVVTDRRLLLGRGILRREERSIPRNRVNRVKFVRRGLYSYTEIDVVEGDRHHAEMIGPLSSRRARQLHDELSDLD
jgi:hypothetical protein